MSDFLHVAPDAENCCARKIAKAISKGEMDGKQEWQCPVCGFDFVARVEGSMTIWDGKPAVLVIRR